MFTDEQLHVLKSMCVNGNFPIAGKELLPLIERTEAAEAVIAASFDHDGMAHIGFDSWHEAYEAWKAAAGR